MLKRVYLFLVFFLFTVSIFLGLDRLCHRSITQFSPHKIKTSNLFIPSQNQAISKEKREEIGSILNQKFVFYHKGKNSYSFISEDGNYLLKFMRTQRVKPKSWLAYIPLSFNPYYQELINTREHAKQLAHAWQFAYEELQEETALIYAHTSKKERLRKKVMLLDKNLDPYSLDLDKTVFCIQRHADLFYVQFSQSLRDHDLNLAKERIASIFSLISHLCCKGVLSSESARHLDIGIVDNRVVQVDIDKLCTCPMCICPKHCKETVLAMTQKFRKWIEEHCQELGPYFDECCENTWNTAKMPCQLSAIDK